MLVPQGHQLANVGGSFNALYVVGDNVGELMFYGRGAGALPTGSAIVSDIIFAATRGRTVRYPFITEENTKVLKDFKTACYLRYTDASDAKKTLDALSVNYSVNGDNVITEVIAESTLQEIIAKTSPLSYIRLL